MCVLGKATALLLYYAGHGSEGPLVPVEKKKSRKHVKCNVDYIKIYVKHFAGH